MSFFKPKQKETKTDEERLQHVEQEIRKLKAEVLDTATALDSIRNKVMRKIQGKTEETPVENQKVFKPGHSYY